MSVVAVIFFFFGVCGEWTLLVVHWVLFRYYLSLVVWFGLTSKRPRSPTLIRGQEIQVPLDIGNKFSKFLEAMNLYLRFV